jgi:hypothetical protein
MGMARTGVSDAHVVFTERIPAIAAASFADRNIQERTPNGPLGQALMVGSSVAAAAHIAGCLRGLTMFISFQIALAIIAREPSRSRFGCHRSLPGHYGVGRQQFRFGHILILA